MIDSDFPHGAPRAWPAVRRAPRAFVSSPPPVSPQLGAEPLASLAAPSADPFHSSGQSPGTVALPAPFALRRGGELAQARLAFERCGPEGAPVVVVLGGISAHRHVAAHPADPTPGWWRGVAGDRLGLDSQRFQILSFDWLGGAGGSTAPAEDRDFPFLDAADQAAALWFLCDALGIEHVHAIVGASYGGMVALHAAAQAPERIDRLVVLAAAHKSDPQARAWRHVQRGIVELGVDSGRGADALALARGLAMTTYRSPDELRQRFASGGDVTGWLDARGASFGRMFRPEQFLCLNRSIDAHAIDPAAVRTETWLCAFASDQLVPPADVRELALALPRLKGFRELGSRFGHDAFLKETRRVGGFLREVLR
jgi:homoserine O-acetyltransferase